MIKKGYYPGCSASGTSKEYAMSTKKVYEALDIKLDELKGWICCGSSPAHSSSLLLADALALKNLSLAKEQELKELIIPCMGCYSRFIFAKHDFENDEEQRRKAEESAGVMYDDAIKNIEIIHPLAYLSEHIDEIKNKISGKANGLKAVCYYGCVFTRPPEITHAKNFENPTEMDELVKVTGAEILDWNSKTKCCGASYSITNQDISFKLCDKILTDAKDAGAEIIIVACPLCQSNLDMRQKQIEKKFNKKFNIPVIYIAQLLGLALGYSYRDLGLDKEFLDSKNLLMSKGML